MDHPGRPNINVYPGDALDVTERLASLLIAAGKAIELGAAVVESQSVVEVEIKPAEVEIETKPVPKKRKKKVKS